MVSKKTLSTFLFQASVTTLSFILLTASVWADSGGLGERWFISGFTGQSELRPNTANSAFELGDKSDSAFNISIGYDFNAWLSGEGYAADLGKAGINLGGSRRGNISYSSVGVSLLTYFPVRTRTGLFNLGKREGISVFFRFGIGMLDTLTELPVQQKQDAHFLLGGGIEYGWQNGLAVRLERTSFDQDANIVGLSLVKRFGKEVNRKGLPLVETRKNIINKETVSETAMAAAIKPGIQDKTGRRNKIRKGFFHLVLPIVYLEQSGGQLVIANEDKPALIKLAKTLSEKRHLKLEVGHYKAVDHPANGKGNAKKVIAFLIKLGVNPKQLREAPAKTTKPNNLLPIDRVDFSLIFD